jgi:two-component sensor histidine kinase
MSMILPCPLFSSIMLLMDHNVVLMRRSQPSFLTEPETLAFEARHRLVNSLTVIASVVRMHARTIANRTEPVPVEDVRLVLEEVGVRLEAVGRLHGCLAPADSPGNTDLANYLREVAQSVVASLSFAGQMQLSFNIPAECLVPSHTAELVMNAIKYAHPSGIAGHLLIGCYRTSDAIAVEVVDDGVGFPEGFHPKTDGNFGLQLVRCLADQLKAQLVLDDTGLGVSARLSIPA